MQFHAGQEWIETDLVLLHQAPSGSREVERIHQQLLACRHPLLLFTKILALGFREEMYCLTELWAAVKRGQHLDMYEQVGVLTTYTSLELCYGA